MSWKATLRSGALIAAGATLGFAPAAHALPPEQASPTCSDTLGITVHGQHIVGDYITGIGSDVIDWPPSDGDVSVGQTVAENGGPVVPGGPGPGFHFPNGFAPGASFCTDSQAPGTHL